MRRCGWLGYDKTEAERIVWARAGQKLSSCPRSYVSPESIAWLEGHRAGRLFGFGDVLGMPARDVDAFRVIENEREKESEHDGR